MLNKLGQKHSVFPTTHSSENFKVPKLFGSITAMTPGVTTVKWPKDLAEFKPRIN